MLNLLRNKFGDEGIRYLADALQHNKVKITLFLLSFIIIQYRNSLH